jgi:hypothetical protein
MKLFNGRQNTFQTIKRGVGNDLDSWFPYHLLGNLSRDFSSRSIKIGIVLISFLLQDMRLKEHTFGRCSSLYLPVDTSDNSKRF